MRWFVIGVLTLGIGATTAYFLRDWQLERRAVAGRDAGMKLLEQGDHFHAMHSIGPYLRRHPNDVAALIAYASARKGVREPDHKHISEALVLYRRALSLQPKNAAAAEALLRLYQDYGLTTEALQLSGDVLAMDPKNRVALEARTVALYRVGRFAKDEALNAAVAFTDAYPGEMSGQLLALEILQRTDSSPERVMARCQQLRKTHPEDARFILLSGIAYLSVGDDAEAKKCLQDACARQMDDPVALQLLVEYCDKAGMFGESLNVLQRHGNKGKEFASLLARRLWELERDADVVNLVGSNASDGEQLALACLSLKRLDRKDEAAQRAKQLQTAAQTDAVARLWSPIVDALVSKAAPDDAAVITACHRAMEDKTNPHIQFLLAEAYLHAGDAETAVQLWREISAAAPGWSAPLSHLGYAALSAGRYDEAEKLAQAAIARKDDNAFAILLLAKARVGRSSTLDAKGAADAMALLDRVEKVAPSEPLIVPLRVNVLAISGRKDEAVAAVRKAIAAAPPMSAAGLMQLSMLSETLRLGTEEECLSRFEQLYGSTADLAYLRAMRLAAGGQPTQALEQFAKARAQAASEKPVWNTAWARLLELAGDARAKQAWIDAADASPDDSMLQWVAISAKSVQNDRDFVARVLERLKQRVGDQGFSWRLSRARWLLQGDKNQNAVEAALVLNELTRSAPNMLAPRLMLAECLQQLGNTSGAIEQLTAASNLWPQSPLISLQLAKLLHQTGETARSRVHLDRVVSNPAADLNQCREAAALLEAQGDAKAALAALEKAYGPAIKEPPRDLLLARLLWRTNQPARVEEICKRFADSSDVNELSFAAEFYDDRGRAAETAALLQKLQAAKAPAGVKELILAGHAMRGGEREKALALFQSATQAAPKNAVAWRQLVRVQLMLDKPDEAIKSLTAARAVLPEDAAFAAALRQAPVIFKSKAKYPELLGLLSDLMDSADDEATVIATIEALGNDQESKLTATAINKISALATSRPRLFGLQVLAARVCNGAGRMEEASSFARRAAEVRVDATGLAVQALAAAKRWDDVAQLLRPHLGDGTPWRIDWMKFAAVKLPEAADASAWLKEVEPLVMAGQVSERLALAESWQAVAQRTGDPADKAHAAEITKNVAAEYKGSPPAAEIALSLGCLQEAQGDLAAAEASYRKSLELKADNPIALNNLAMLLARSGERLDEALSMAKRAAASGDGKFVSFYDTLAFVQVQRKEYGAAIETLNTALKLKPDHLWCQIRLTDALAQSGQMDKARATLQTLEKGLSGHAALTDEMSAQLRELRTRLARQNS